MYISENWLFGVVWLCNQIICIKHTHTCTLLKGVCLIWCSLNTGLTVFSHFTFICKPGYFRNNWFSFPLLRHNTVKNNNQHTLPWGFLQSFSDPLHLYLMHSLKKEWKITSTIRYKNQNSHNYFHPLMVNTHGIIYFQFRTCLYVWHMHFTMSQKVYDVSANSSWIILWCLPAKKMHSDNPRGLLRYISDEEVQRPFWVWN